MAVVTITSDYGTKDHYVSALKGAIIKEVEQPFIFDISHEISLFSIKEAAFVVSGAFHHYPKKSIHVIAVDEYSKDNEEFIILEFENHFFIAVNNGIHSLITKGRQDYEAFTVDRRITDEFENKQDAYAKITGHLLRGGQPGIIGSILPKLKEASVPNPVVSGDNTSIIGNVQHIDHFGNLVTNISKTLFYEIGGTRAFEISIPRERRVIKKIYKNHGEVNGLATLFASFNSEGWLEIAIYKPVSKKLNSAQSLLGIALGDSITVQFL